MSAAADARVQRWTALLFLAAGAAGLLLGLPGGPRPLERYIVADASAVAVAPDVEALRAGTASLLAGGGDMATQLMVGALRGLMSGRLGFDPLEPKVFAELGVDPARGAALVGAAEGCAYLVIGVADQAVLRGQVQRLLGQQGLTAAADTADPELYAGRGRAVALTFPDRDLLLVACADLTLGASAPTPLAERARRLLERVRDLAPADTLPVRDPGYHRSLAAVGSADLTIYATLGALLTGPAPAAGPAAQESAVLGLTLGPGRLDLSGRLMASTVAADLRALLAVTEPPADLLGWIPARAALALRIGLVPGELVERLDAALGQFLPQGLAPIRRQAESLGLDWEQDVLGNLTGHLGYARVPQARGLFGLGGGPDESRHLVLLQVRGPERARSALTRAAEEISKATAAGRLQLDLPPPTEQPLFRVEGPIVLLSTDGTWLHQLAPGPGPQLPADLPATLGQVRSRPDVALLYLDLTRLGGEIPALGRLAAALSVDGESLRLDASFLTGRGGAR